MIPLQVHCGTLGCWCVMFEKFIVFILCHPSGFQSDLLCSFFIDWLINQLTSIPFLPSCIVISCHPLHLPMVSCVPHYNPKIASPHSLSWSRPGCPWLLFCLCQIHLAQKIIMYPRESIFQLVLAWGWLFLAQLCFLQQMSKHFYGFSTGEMHNDLIPCDIKMSFSIQFPI